MEACWDTPRSEAVALVAAVDGEGAVPLLPLGPDIECRRPLPLIGCLRRSRTQTWTAVAQIVLEQAARSGYRRAEAEHSQGPVGR